MTISVLFEPSDMDILVQCQSCFRLRPLREYLDDLDGPDRAKDFCLNCGICDGPTQTVGGELLDDLRPAGFITQAVFNWTIAIRRTLLQRL